jgi:hypothetical protein
VESVLAFEDGREPVIDDESRVVSDEFGRGRPPPKVWSESVQSIAEARSGELFHTTTGRAELTREWVSPVAMLVSGRVDGSVDNNVHDSDAAARSYSLGPLGARLYLLLQLTTPAQLVIDYSLTCCHAEFKLFDAGPGSFNTLVFGASALQSIPPEPTTGRFAQLLEPDWYLLIADAHFAFSDSSRIPGTVSSSFDLRLQFDDVSAVPEPGPGPMLALGLLGLVVALRSAPVRGRL